MDDDQRPRGTATLAGARDDARAQVGVADERVGVRRPAAESPEVVGLPPDVRPDAVRWAETVPVGGYSARRVARDTLVRIDDVDGDACASILVFNAANTAERLNVADTVKVQWQAYLGPGALLLSDLGRVLLTIVEDTGGHHDCLCGASNRATNDARYGDGSASGPTPNARDLLALGGLKHGLSRLDIGPAINLFRKVVVGSDGALQLVDGAGPSSITLRAELDVFVLVANTPHPLDDRAGYPGGPIRLLAWQADREADDPFRTSSPERLRAFLNTEDHLLELGGHPAGGKDGS